MIGSPTMDRPLSLGTLIEMAAEVSHFVDRGMDADQARKIVGLPPGRLYVGGVSNDAIKYLPTPKQIREAAEDIKAGRVVVSEKSGSRWRDLRELKEASERWELAGPIEDDRCELPSWFGG